MRDRGATLQHFGGNDWRLSNGQHVSATVARILTFDRNVVGAGDSLLVPLFRKRGDGPASDRAKA
jgi:hypothetical protein